MNAFQVPREEPSIIFPIGAIIEDVKAKYKILEFRQQKTAHLYRVEVLERKMPIPESMKAYMTKPYEWILVLAQNLPNITRIE